MCTRYHTESNFRGTQFFIAAPIDRSMGLNIFVRDSFQLHKTRNLNLLTMKIITLDPIADLSREWYTLGIVISFSV